jgi:hypothetical protein
MGVFDRPEVVTFGYFLDQEIYQVRLDFQGSRWLYSFQAVAKDLGKSRCY